MGAFQCGAVLRDSEKTNIPSPILASGHLGPIFNRKILDVARYACGFAQSARTQIWPKPERNIAQVISGQALRENIRALSGKTLISSAPKGERKQSK